MKIYVVFAVACLMMIGTAQAIELGEGECFSFNNATFCAPVCTVINETTCSGYVSDALENYTSELSGKCLAFENISSSLYKFNHDIELYINNTFGTLSEGFIDDCNAAKASARSWEEDQKECEERLLSLNDFDVQIQNLQQNLTETRRLKSEYYNDKVSLQKSVDDLSKTQYSSFLAGAGLAALLMWWFFIKKKNVKATGDEESFEPIEGQ